MWVEPDAADLVIVTAQPEQLEIELSGSGYPAAIEIISLQQICQTESGHPVQAGAALQLPPKAVCLIADIRVSQPSLLKALAQQAPKIPILVLSDSTVEFLPGYPFDCEVMGLVHIEELCSSKTPLLQRRVAEAVQSYLAPISLGTPGNPVIRAFQQIVDNSSDWFIVKDLQHRFVVVPERFCGLKDLSLDKIIGKDDLQIGTSHYDVFGDEESGWPGFWKQDDAVTMSGEMEVEYSPKWRHSNPATQYKYTERVPLKNARGEVYGLLVCVKDISEQVHKERLLSERTEMLDQMTKEKQRSEHHHEVAEAAVAAKNRFLAAASHDLRQPLHAMGLFLDVLESRLTDEEELELIGKLKESNSALFAMFSSLLDISRLDAGVVEPELVHINVYAHCSAIQNEFRQLAESNGLEFYSDIDDCVVYTDLTMCARIVRNLLRNAIENTEEGSISLNVRSNGSHVRLDVIDTGCGIEPENIEDIFKEYFHDKTRRGEGHIGLGLAIVERMCKLLNIKITVSSKPGEGSIFTLLIPKGDVSQVREAVVRNLQSPSADIRVLVLDDEELILEGTRSVLNLNGCSTMVASSSDRAFEVLADSDGPPDIIIADYELGYEETGVTAIARIRDEIGQRIPAILVTGDTSSERKSDAIDHGFEILHKPIEPTALLQAIHRLHDGHLD